MWLHPNLEYVNNKQIAVQTIRKKWIEKKNKIFEKESKTKLRTFINIDD